MKEYRIEKPGTILCHEKPKPMPKAGEALIKVLNLSLCGSDVHLFKGSYNGPHEYPVLFGHEWSGVIEAVGEDVEGLRPGDLVTGDCSRYCGECSYCARDKNLCENIGKFGINLDGASAEYFTREACYIYKAPEGMDPLLLSLSEPMAVAAHLLARLENLGSVFKNKKILLLGGGGIGLSLLILLRRFYRIEGISFYDPSELRSSIARDLGAKVLSESPFQKEASGSGYASLYSGILYDLVLDTTGSRKVFESLFSIVKPLGFLGCLGMVGEALINQKMIIMKGLTVTGTIGGTGEFPKVMDLLRRFPEDAKRIISHVMPIEEASIALELSRDAGKTVKVALQVNKG